MINKLINKSISLTYNRLVKYIIIIIFIIIPNYYMYSQQNICEGSSNSYVVDSNENGGIGTIGSTYQWIVSNPSFQGNITLISPPASNGVNINWLNTPPGNYILKVIETNVEGCSSSQNLQINIFANPRINLTDQIACVDPESGAFINSILLQTGLSNTQYRFEWFHDGVALTNTNPSINVNSAGVYSVITTHLISGCSSTSEASVTVSSAPIASLIVNEPFNEVQTISVIINNGIGTYEYAINDGFFQESPIFTVENPGEYNITVRDKYFCGETKLIAHVINYPHYFTPNNDGENDTWNIIGLPSNYNALVSIFDRYGKLLYQFNPKYSNWNGVYNNNLVPSTDYWFTIDYSDESNQKYVFKSHFSLIR